MPRFEQAKAALGKRGSRSIDLIVAARSATIRCSGATLRWNCSNYRYSLWEKIKDFV
jgi:hypothetical protein